MNGDEGKRIRSMTLNLPEREMEILERMCKTKDMTKTGLIRQSLRLYSLIDSKLCEGVRIKFVNEDGSDVEPIFTGGCGWNGID